MKNKHVTKMEVTNEPLIANAGLAVIGQLMHTAGIGQINSNRGPVQIHDPDIIKTVCGLIAVGKVGYDHVRLFEEEPFFQEALGIGRMPKEASLRQRLESMSRDASTHEAVLDCAVSLLRKTKALPKRIDLPGFKGYRADTDTTILNNSKTKLFRYRNNLVYSDF